MTHSGYHILAAYCEGKINLINPCLVRIITVKYIWTEIIFKVLFHIAHSESYFSFTLDIVMLAITMINSKLKNKSNYCI